MAFTIGTTVGSYEILSLIGKGGMGEVYRARDSKLKREVAIKTLPDEFSRDPERLARFQREAEALAALSHPNIGSIYHLEETGGSRYLILELIEGDTLAEVLAKRGALPLDEALNIAKQICEALEAAHEKGITHRDLKPANIKITPDGKAKLLDFGLARVFEPSANSGLSNSPTLLSAGSMSGVILGTVAYMSPEQARGRIADKRADVWAFGCVLYEMLSGKQAFEGETVPDVIAHVLEREPDWSRLPAATPGPVISLLRRCLSKDASERMRHPLDSLLLLKDKLDHNLKSPETKTGFKRNWLLGSSVGFLVIFLMTWLVLLQSRRPSGDAGVMRFSVPTPDSGNSSTSSPAQFAISPDGRFIVSMVLDQGQKRLWLRAIDSLDGRIIPNTDGATWPFWFKDSKSIGFFANGKLMKVELSGNALSALADLHGIGWGGTSNERGTVLFADGIIYRVTAPGVQASAVTNLDSSSGLSEERFPSFLPDGQHFLFYGIHKETEKSGIYVGSVDSSDVRFVAPSKSRALYAPTGHLLFQRDGRLLAQPFDEKRLMLSGNPDVIAENFTFGAAAVGLFSMSNGGTLVYRYGPNLQSAMVWFDRSGRETGHLDQSDVWLNPTLSPDGKRVAVIRSDAIWIFDLMRNTSSRFTFGPGIASLPIWSPDGRRIAYGLNTARGEIDIDIKPADGAADGQRLASLESIGGGAGPTDWSKDGAYILFQNQQNIGMVKASGSGTPSLLLHTPFYEGHGTFSPDGKWLAYASEQSGKTEVYICAFPSLSGLVQISKSGGHEPRWRSDGKELFYLSADEKMVAVSLTTQPMLQVGQSKELFQARPRFGPGAYTVTPDGQKFLINSRIGEQDQPLTVVVNWPELLKK